MRRIGNSKERPTGEEVSCSSKKKATHLAGATVAAAPGDGGLRVACLGGCLL